MQVTPGVYFDAPPTLPKGPHSLTREQVQATQRERLMAAMAELLAERGYRGVSVGEVATRSGVSRSAFYDCFKDKDACAFSAYERFIDVQLTAMAERAQTLASWDDVVLRLLESYLETLQADLVVARAFQVEIDAVGPQARSRRREALHRIAAFVRAQHERLCADNPTLKPPFEMVVYLGAIYAVRQLACDALDAEREPDLMSLVPALARWLADSARWPAVAGPAPTG